MIQFLSPVIELDKKLFHLINQQWTNSFFDWLMPHVTDFKVTRFYLLGLILLFILVKRTTAVKIIMGCLLTVLISDVTAAQIIKPLVGRSRPEFSTPPIRLIVPEQGSPSFPSNHSTNSFALATFLSLAAPALNPLYFIIASVIAYSRVYVGVHYPFDVMGGALWGIFCGIIGFRLFLAALKYFGLSSIQGIPPAPKKFYRRRRRRS